MAEKAHAANLRALVGTDPRIGSVREAAEAPIDLTTLAHEPRLAE